MEVTIKVYIVGPVASGKSTLAKDLSKEFNIPYRSLDDIVHILDSTQPWGNRKRPTEERDKLFLSIITLPSWIIEDVGRPCFEEGLKLADMIILLDTPRNIRRYRILIRWIKQRLGMEECLYKPRLKMLICMFRWSKEYDTGKDNLKERLSPYYLKVTVIKNKTDYKAFKIIANY